MEVNHPDRRLRACPRICIGGMKDSRPVVTAEEIDLDREDPVIRLSLRKPRNWNWKLTTSASSPAVILPNIRLVDDNGNVLHDDTTSKLGSNGGGDKNINRAVRCVRRGSETEKRHSLRSEPEQRFRVRAKPEQRYSVQVEPEQRYNVRAPPKQRYSVRTEPEQSYSVRAEPEQRYRVREEPEQYYSVRTESEQSYGVRAEPEQSYSIRTESEQSYSTRDEPEQRFSVLAESEQSYSDRAGPEEMYSVREEPELRYVVHVRDRTSSTKPSSEDSFSCHPKRRTRRTKTKTTTSSASSGSRRMDQGVQHQPRKQDSGYKSLRKGVDYVPRCRRQSSEVSEESSSASEALADKSRRTKAKHRKAFVIGDCLLSVSDRQSRLYGQPVDLLTCVPDVVQLKVSHRNDNSPSSRRTRRHQRRQRPLSAMGSNVSRHSDKGMSGRRTQSSGNLCNGNKILSRDVGRILATCGNVGQKDRNRFCGSLPNYLDGEYEGNELEVRCCNNNNNHNGHVVEYLVSSENDVASSSMERKTGLVLRLAPQQDAALHDQGYASERSPEDEHAPPPPPAPPERNDYWWLTEHYPFITPGGSFDVSLLKGNRGLGLSVTGGVDTDEQWPGLIRIKRLFPQQPAAQCGQLATGDILLAANGVPLTGLTNYQALEVLRTTPNNVMLVVCRPPSDVFSVSAPSAPPLPPRRDASHRLSSGSHTSVGPLPVLHIQEPYGEFDILLKKVNRSLGFTLRKEDESALGHYVRALVREPALSDGRIRPGDKIVEVNDVPLSPMSHEEAVTFLRQCGETVKLRLYRDAAQTPVAALSPTDMDPGGCMRPRPMLRQEARDMLSDIAGRRLSPSNSSGSGQGLLHCLSGGSSPGTSPRRRRLTKTPSPEMHAVIPERLSERYPTSSHNEDSDEECSRKNSFTGERATREDNVDETKPQRPQFLNLYSQANSPQASWKPKYTFSVTSSKTDDGSDSLTPTGESEYVPQGSYLAPGEDMGGGPLLEPVSLPPLSSTSSTSTAFSYRNPAYQSANPTCNGGRKPTDGDEGMAECSSDQDLSEKVFDGQPGGSSLLKWKGVVFTQQNGKDDSLSTDPTENEEVLTVELNRGWNSRLGFSLQADGFRTYISAIYADSVAAKDGRLRAQDQLLTVNDENVETMTTAEIIDLLRKIRGTIEIRVLRKCGPQDQSS